MYSNQSSQKLSSLSLSRGYKPATWPYVKYNNLNHINDKYRKRGRVCTNANQKKDFVRVNVQKSNYLTSKTMVSFEWSIENFCSAFQRVCIRKV